MIEKAIYLFQIFLALFIHAFSYAQTSGAPWTPNLSSKKDQTQLLYLIAQRHPRLTWLDTFGVNPLDVLSIQPSVASQLGTKNQNLEINDAHFYSLEYLNTDFIPDEAVAEIRLNDLKNLIVKASRHIEEIFISHPLANDFKDDLSFIAKRVKDPEIRLLFNQLNSSADVYNAAVNSYFVLFPLLRDLNGKLRSAKGVNFPEVEARVKTLQAKDFFSLYKGPVSNKFVKKSGMSPELFWLSNQVQGREQIVFSTLINNFVVKKVVPATLFWKNEFESFAVKGYAAMEITPSVAYLTSIWGGDCSSKVLPQFQSLKGTHSYLLLTKLPDQGINEAGYLFYYDTELDSTAKAPYFISVNGPTVNSRLYLSSILMMTQSSQSDGILVPDITHNPYVTDNEEIKNLLESFSKIGEPRKVKFPEEWKEKLEPMAMELKKKYRERFDPALNSESLTHAVWISREQLREQVQNVFKSQNQVLLDINEEVVPSLYLKSASFEKRLPWLSLGLILEWGGDFEALKDITHLSDEELNALKLLMSAHRSQVELTAAEIESLIRVLKIKLNDIPKFAYHLQVDLLLELYREQRRVYKEGEWKSAILNALKIMEKENHFDIKLIKLAMIEAIDLKEFKFCNHIYGGAP